MRRLIIDKIVEQAEELKKVGDLVGYQRNIELLQNIACSIIATIQPGQTQHPKKLEEIAFIAQCIGMLKKLP